MWSLRDTKKTMQVIANTFIVGKYNSQDCVIKTCMENINFNKEKSGHDNK